MPLEATVQTLEGLSEEVAALYSQKDDGTYQLAILDSYVPADKVEDTGGLKSALRKERETVSALTGKLKGIEERFAGIDLDEFNELRQKQREAEEAEAMRKGEWDSLKAQMRDAHTEQLGKKDTDIARMRKEIERLTIDAQATAAINEVDGNVTLLTPHVKSLVKLVEEEGVFKPQVVDATGTPRVDGDGNPLSIKALVSEMRDQDVYKGAFKGTGAQGGGTPPGDGGEGNPNANGGGTPPVSFEGKSRSQMSPKEKVAFINEHGNDKFQSLPL
jgi:hypothetical protein